MVLLNELEIVEIEEKDSIVIINLINGNADILDKKYLRNFNNGDFKELPSKIIEQMIDRKYIFNSREHYKKYIQEVNQQLIEELNNQAPNFVYVPNYTCNLKCYYCFENAYEKDLSVDKNINKNIKIIFNAIESIIRTIEKQNKTKFKNSDIPVYITGGEPLLLCNKAIIDEILFNINKNKYSCGIVTNGTTINYYVDVIKKRNIDNIQVTLDGSRKVHDNIRIFKDDKPSFDIIIKNIELVHKYVDNINIRINLTKKNIDSLYKLIDELNFIKDKKNINPYIYIMQQEGNSENSQVIEEVECLKLLLSKKEIKEFFGISFHGKNIIDGIFCNKVFNPKIAVCSAMSNQYILDYKGNIYKCWWGMGNDDVRVGTFSESGVEFNEKVDYYKKRNIVNISKCANCKYRYVCAGGCTGVMNVDKILNGETKCPQFNKIFNYIIKSELLR